MKPARIAQVTLTMGQGGIENLLVALAENQTVECYKTVLYCLDQGGDLLKYMDSLGIPSRVMGRLPGFDLKLIYRLARAFKDDGIHLVHTHNEAAHFYGCLAARLARIPVINTEHSRHYIDGHRRRKLEKRFLSFLTHRVVTVSDELRNASIEQDSLSACRLTVIANGVDHKRFSSTSNAAALQLKKKLGFQSETKVITIVARLNPIKNHQLLLKAFSQLQVHLPGSRLLVVGDGELRSELEELTVQLSLQKVVVFLGDRADVPLLLKASDALTLCSHREGLPLVLLEGMAAEVPIVVTEGANRSSLVKHRLTGLVCRGEAQSLAESLHTALTGCETTEMVENAKKLVVDQYSIRQTVAHYETLYQQALS